MKLPAHGAREAKCFVEVRRPVGARFPGSRLHGQVTADVRGGAARRWDGFRVGDPAMRDVGSLQQAQIEWRSGPIDGMRVHPPRLSPAFIQSRAVPGREINTDAPACHSKRRFVTRAVPDVENLDAEGLLAEVVEDAVRTKDNLARCSSRPARIGGADKRKRRKNANVVEYAPPNPAGCLRVMLGDLRGDVLKVRNRRV